MTRYIAIGIEGMNTGDTAKKALSIFNSNHGRDPRVILTDKEFDVGVIRVSKNK